MCEELREAVKVAYEAVAKVSGEVRRRTSAGGFPTLTKTQAERLVLVPIVDERDPRAMLAAAHAALDRARCRIKGG